MRIKLTHVLVSLILILLMSTVMLASFIKARSVADKTMMPVLNEWYYYGTNFYPFMRNETTDHIDGPSWLISYDAREMFSGPLSVQVDLFGNIIRTNPPSLRERIKEKEKQKRPLGNNH